MTTVKTIALTRWTFVGKVVSLLFTMLSRLVIAFLPRSKCLLISWLQSPPAMILEPKKIKSVTVSTVSPSICREVMGPDAMLLVFWMLSDWIGEYLDLSSWSWVGSGEKSERKIWLSPERRGPTAGKAAVWQPGVVAAEPMVRALLSSSVCGQPPHSLTVFTSMLWP